MIEIRDLSKTYHTKSGSHEALCAVDLTIADGDIFGIIGPSGAGKSTLVRCLNLLERPTAGQVLIDGVDVTGYRGRALRALRGSIGMIFQDFSLFAQRNVLQNVLFPLEVRGLRRAEALERAHELLDLVGLAEKTGSYPAQLSGGQQQRVAIARALANNPRIMLCDEATSALDSMTTASILDLLKDINKRFGMTLVVITHAMSVIEAICNRVAVIDGARIVEQGTVDRVFRTPQASITRQLLRGRGSVRGDEQDGESLQGGNPEAAGDELGESVSWQDERRIRKAQAQRMILTQEAKRSFDSSSLGGL